MQDHLNNFLNETGIEIKIKSDEKLCQTQQQKIELESSTKFVM